MSSAVTLTAISRFCLVTADPERLTAFYVAIGFTAGPVRHIAALEMGLLGRDGFGWRRTMTLGPSRLDLDWFDRPGRRYPADSIASDLVFQHCAVVTDDPSAAWQRAQAAGATPITRGDPVTLPASAGGVTAVKLRDPDGHPLELLAFPAGANEMWRGSGVMGIDHSAISVADVAASRQFYQSLGLTSGKSTLNQGPTQVALDGLDDVVAGVVPMQAVQSPPHLELLHYRIPAGRRSKPLDSNDVAATRIVWLSDREALIRDPDGHLHQLMRADQSPANTVSP